MGISRYDAIIVGAGPAGAASAALLAARGWRVLLVEKSSWPRAKACGGCLNAAGVEMLRAAGLGETVADAAPLTRMELCTAGHRAHFALPPGAVINRAEFDARLAAVALARGCTFSPDTRATLDLVRSDLPCVRLHHAGATERVHARVLLACDGLGTGSGFLAAQDWARVQTAPDSRLGFATTVEFSMPSLATATLRMCVGSEGYVGIVRQNDGSIHVGAALDPQACNAARGPLAVMRGILQTSGSAGEALLTTNEIIGTGPLTRMRPIVGRGRILALGDACGYVEPFTGEGISWAIRSACAAVELLPQNPTRISDDIGDRWHARYVAQIRPRQSWCRGLRPILSRPRLTRLGVGVAQALPAAAQRLARHISA